jgi:hypothetical protein
MQTIEAAVHRWDAENAIGVAQPVAADLAGDAVRQNFTVMVPAAVPGSRPRPDWASGSGSARPTARATGTVHFDGDDVRLTESTGPWDVELAGTASDLMLFLWHRIPADSFDEVAGDRRVLDRYFALVPPV